MTTRARRDGHRLMWAERNCSGALQTVDFENLALAIVYGEGWISCQGGRKRHSD